MGVVKCFTLKASNATLLSEMIESEDEFVYVLKNPVIVLLVPPKSNKDAAGISFTPYLQYTDEYTTGIKIHRADVLTVTTPVIELINQYNSVFGSGIILASSLLQGT